MTHIRTQIRHQFRDLLAASLPPSQYIIAASRKHGRNADHDAAYLNVLCLNDQVRAREVQRMGDDSVAQLHVASIYIRVQRTGNGDTLDDALDADEVLVNNAIMGADWSSLLEEAPTLEQSNFSTAGEGEKDLAEIVIRYDCEYRVVETDLEQVIS